MILQAIPEIKGAATTCIAGIVHGEAGQDVTLDLMIWSVAALSAFVVMPQGVLVHKGAPPGVGPLVPGGT